MSKATAELCMGCMSPLRGGRQECPHCGYSTLAQGNEPDYIQPGTTLSTRYIIGRLTHKNGEGALYIGFDNATKRSVWIHEYYPHSIAGRGLETGAVLPLQGYGAQYKAQMSDFVDICNEVKRLSGNEPVITIENVINENNTVYAIYKDMDVVPLEEYLQSRGGKLPYDEAVKMFLPLLGTLGSIHGRGHIHRGISPHTVYADRRGKLYLWHFSLAATRTAGCELEAELFSGYSAPEQYSPSGWQGTWTDVYAAGALLYRMMSGTAPPNSGMISRDRPVTPLEDLVMGIPQNISSAVYAAMTPSSDRRTQAVATLSAQLSQTGTTTTDTTVYRIEEVTKSRPQQAARNNKNPGPQDRRERRVKDDFGRGDRGMSAKYVALALVLTVTVLVGLIVLFMHVVYPTLVPHGEGPSSVPQWQEEFPDADDDDEPPIDNIVPRLVFRNINDVMSSDALAELRERYEFKIEQEYTNDWPEHTIIDQNPVEGTEMESGVITLTVSRGPLILEMPALEGLLRDEAIIILESLSTEAEIRFQIYVRYDSSAPPDTVISTSPSHGATFDPKDQQVVLFVSPERQEEEQQQHQQELPPQEDPNWPFFRDSGDISNSEPPPIVFR